MPVISGNTIKIKSLLQTPCPLVQSLILSYSVFNFEFYKQLLKRTSHLHVSYTLTTYQIVVQ